MIVFNYKNIEDFLAKLPLRIGDEIFIQYIEPEENPELSQNRHKLILQFLGKASQENQQLTILHQCQLIISGPKQKGDILKTIQNAFNGMDGLRIVEGFINEIFMSIS